MSKWQKRIYRAACWLFLLAIGGVFGSIEAQAGAKAYDYLVPDADVRYMTEDEIADMPLQVVCYAKNEIYARHGRMFVSQELTDYFEEQLWYYGCISASDFSSSVLNVYETYNIQLLSDREKALRSGGYQLDQPGYNFSAIYDYLYGYCGYVLEDDYFIFPDSDCYYLSSADVEGMTLQEICYGKNEIYARHGRQFVSQELTDYFNTKTWYYGSIAPSDFNSGVFNAYENANIQFLSDLESSWSNGAGYQLDQPGYDIYAVGISSYYYQYDRLENDFIFYDSDSRYLTQEEIQGLSLQVICYAKNEIYARRGRMFQSGELQDYFDSKPWYYGRISPESFSPEVFNKYETANVELLNNYEHTLNPNGYQLAY